MGDEEHCGLMLWLGGCKKLEELQSVGASVDEILYNINFMGTTPA